MVIVDGVTNPASIGRDKLISLLGSRDDSIAKMIDAEYPNDFSVEFKEQLEGRAIYAYDEDNRSLTLEMHGEVGTPMFYISCHVDDGGDFGFGMM